MDATVSESSVDTVRRFYDLLSAGDLDAATELLDDELVIHEPAGLPYGGEYHGPGGFQDIMGRINGQFQPEMVGPVTCLDSGNPVVVRLVGRFTSRATGRSVEMDVVELFTVRQGRIVILDVYYKDPGAVAALVA